MFAAEDIAMPEVPAEPARAAHAPQASVPVDVPQPAREVAVEAITEPLLAVATEPPKVTAFPVHPNEPFRGSASRTPSNPPHIAQYGPIRCRHSTKKLEVVFRPPQSEAVDDLRNEKRASSRTPSCEPPAKSSRTEAMLAVVKSVESIESEVFLPIS